jgi:hypothetical protein
VWERRRRLGDGGVWRGLWDGERLGKNGERRCVWERVMVGREWRLVECVGERGAEVSGRGRRLERVGSGGVVWEREMVRRE